jgi:hypothetical protein
LFAHLVLALALVLAPVLALLLVLLAHAPWLPLLLVLAQVLQHDDNTNSVSKGVSVAAAHCTKQHPTLMLMQVMCLASTG